jgi:hypothetical protein
MSKMIFSFGRRAAFLCLALAVFNLHPATLLATYAEGTPAPHTGEITSAGGVKVDGALAVSGQTFFPGSTFAVAPASLSILTLRNHGRLELSAETTLKLDFSDDQIVGALEAGRLRVFAPARVTARLMTSDATVLADSGQPVMFSVERGREGATTVSVEVGRVEMSTGNQTQTLSAGQMLSTSGGAPSLANKKERLSAGKKIGLGLGVAGLVAMIAIIFTGGEDEEMLNFGGCVHVGLSDTTDHCR